MKEPTRSPRPTASAILFGIGTIFYAVAMVFLYALYDAKNFDPSDASAVLGYVVVAIVVLLPALVSAGVSLLLQIPALILSVRLIRYGSGKTKIYGIVATVMTSLMIVTLVCSCIFVLTHLDASAPPAQNP